MKKIMSMVVRSQEQHSRLNSKLQNLAATIITLWLRAGDRESKCPSSNTGSFSAN